VDGEDHEEERQETALGEEHRWLGRARAQVLAQDGGEELAEALGPARIEVARAEAPVLAESSG
jgi:hypothetical protein